MLRLLIRAAALVLVLAAGGAWAQVPTPGDETGPAEVVLPDPLTPEAVRALVATLPDAAVRALLLERLDAVAREAEAKAAAHPAVFDLAQQGAEDAWGSIRTAVERLPQIPAAVAGGISRFAAPRGWDGVLWVLAAIALAIGAGFVAELAVDRAAGRWRARIRTEEPEGLAETLGLLLRRAFLDAAGLIAFYVVATQAMLALLSSQAPVDPAGLPSFPDAEVATFFLGWVIMVPRIIRAVNRFLMAPQAPALRLIHCDDWTARYVHRQLTIVFALWGLLGFVAPFLASHGVPAGQLRLGFWINLAAFTILLGTVWRARAGLSMMMRGHDPDITPAERRMAELYPYLGIVLIVLTWVLIEALAAQRLWGAVTNAILTMIMLLFAPAFDTAVRGLVRHLVPPMSGEGAVAEAAYISSKRSYIRIGRVLITIGFILGLTWLWGLDLVNIAAAGVGAQIALSLIEIVMILLVGFLVWEVVSLWINRKLAAEQTAGPELDAEEPGGGEGGGAGGSRLATVLPLLLGALKTTIAVVFGLIALGNLGIDITPLLAGAGIVGLAVGFGAQKLVTDVVSGIFFLVDDAFRVGEYVEVEGTRGTVEKISVRSMQLRHHLGPVHTIPYGEIPKLSNYSRDWVIMKLKFTVPFETDPNKVKKLFKQVGREMMDVPEFAQDLLQPFKSQGVFDFDDVGMIIRGKFMAKPGRQFVLRKEIYNRVKKIFEDNGIAFARREVRIALPQGETAADLNDAQKSAITAAAAEVARPEDPPRGG